MGPVPAVPPALPAAGERDSGIASGASSSDARQEHRWPVAGRVAFRFTFCYWTLVCLCGGAPSLFGLVPSVGDAVRDALSWPFVTLAEWIAAHLLHLSGIAAHKTPTGSGDGTVGWLTLAVYVGVSVAAAGLWTALDRRRPNYATLYAWLRFLVRLTLGLGMLVYGFYKVFPIQMQPPSLAVLNETVGNTSPSTLLWTLLGLQPGYEMVCGVAEVAGGLLVLYRRTSLLGALMNAFVMANVVLYNYFFDVPVKILATQLLLMSVFLVLPDVRTLYAIFWQHRPAAPVGAWVPPANRPGLVRATRWVEAAFLLLMLWTTVGTRLPVYRKQMAAERSGSTLRGGWRLDAATVASAKAAGGAADGVIASPWPLVAANGQRMTELWIEMPTRANIRVADGQLWRAYLADEPATRTLRFTSESHVTAAMHYEQPDMDHLVLSGDGNQLRLSRLRLPASYPLLSRGFHLISDYPYER